MHPLYLILIFAVSSLVGYLIIKQVPSLLHTPLMTGMNALAGVCLLGALITVGFSYQEGGLILLIGQVMGGAAIVLATVNVVAGFGVTHRMLKMFTTRKKESDV